MVWIWRQSCGAAPGLDLARNDLIRGEPGGCVDRGSAKAVQDAENGKTAGRQPTGIPVNQAANARVEDRNGGRSHWPSTLALSITAFIVVFVGIFVVVAVVVFRLGIVAVGRGDGISAPCDGHVTRKLCQHVGDLRVRLLIARGHLLRVELPFRLPADERSI